MKNTPAIHLRRPGALFAAILAVLACGCAAPAGTSGEVHRVEVDYADGAPVGGVAQVPIPLGSKVELIFTTDVAEDLHLHGYHHHLLTPAGGTESVTFTADIPGVFEAEAETAKVPLVRLQVG